MISIEKVMKKILVKYLNFINIFLKELAIKLPKYSGINKYIINLEINK